MSTATDDVDGDVSVTVIRSVNTNVPGIYTLVYTVQDSTGNQANPERGGHCRDNCIAPQPEDRTPPSITLLNNDQADNTINCGDDFSAPGAVATDTQDGPVSARVIGVVNSSVPGTYDLVYLAEDSAGNQGRQSCVRLLSWTIARRRMIPARRNDFG